MSANLPILDLSRLHTDREAFLDDLRHAAHDIGFFYVVGHGVPDTLTSEVIELGRVFFSLPSNEKLQIENLKSPQFRGYTRTGTEVTAGANDWREQVDIGPERSVQPITPESPSWKRLIGPNLWPVRPPQLKNAALAWQHEALRVSRGILRALALSLGQNEDYFDRWFDSEASVNMKFVHYPPPSNNGASDQGVGPHKDYGYLALLLQDDVGGLQVQSEQTGEWIDASPIPGSFVVNIGEMLEIATQGYLKATRHRVLSPPVGIDRYSVPFFLGPRLDAVVEPLVLPPKLAAEARGVSQERDNPLHAAFGDNAVRGWLRSHPAVAERYWADVLPPQPRPIT